MYAKFTYNFFTSNFMSRRLPHLQMYSIRTMLSHLDYHILKCNVVVCRDPTSNVEMERRTLWKINIGPGNNQCLMQTNLEGIMYSATKSGAMSHKRFPPNQSLSRKITDFPLKKNVPNLESSPIKLRDRFGTPTRFAPRQSFGFAPHF